MNIVKEKRNDIENKYNIAYQDMKIQEQIYDKAYSNLVDVNQKIDKEKKHSLLVLDVCQKNKLGSSENFDYMLNHIKQALDFDTVSFQYSVFSSRIEQARRLYDELKSSGDYHNNFQIPCRLIWSSLNQLDESIKELIEVVNCLRLTQSELYRLSEDMKIYKQMLNKLDESLEKHYKN